MSGFRVLGVVLCVWNLWFSFQDVGLFFKGCVLWSIKSLGFFPFPTSKAEFWKILYQGTS